MAVLKIHICAKNEFFSKKGPLLRGSLARLQQRHARLGAGGTGVGVPHAALHLADVGTTQQQQAQAALANAAAHGQGQLARQQRLVEGQAAAVVAARDGQLPVQAFGARPRECPCVDSSTAQFSTGSQHSRSPFSAQSS